MKQRRVKASISIIFVASIFFSLAGTFIFQEPEIIHEENRLRTRFPDFDIKRSFRKYFAQIDRFAVDNFPFRQYFLGGYSNFFGAVGVSAGGNEKVYRGRDHWLFIGNDLYQAMDKLEGRLNPMTEKIYMAYAVLGFAQWFQSQGVEVVFLLGPNKSSIYPEQLPSLIRPANTRYVDRSLNWLRNNGVAVIDPTDALIERKAKDIVYWKRDTHWNQIGGAVAFEKVMEFMGIHDCPVWNYELIEDLDSYDLEKFGALEHVPVKMNDNFKISWDDNAHISREEIDYPEGKISLKAHTLVNNSPRQESTIWIVGDSFNGNLTPFLSHCFARTSYFFFDVEKLNDLISAYRQAQSKPQRVILELVERKF